MLCIVPEESRSNARRTVIPARKDATRALCAFVRGAIEPSSARLGAEFEREVHLLPRGMFDSAFFFVLYYSHSEAITIVYVPSKWQVTQYMNIARASKIEILRQAMRDLLRLFLFYKKRLRLLYLKQYKIFFIYVE